MTGMRHVIIMEQQPITAESNYIDDGCANNTADQQNATHGELSPSSSFEVADDLGDLSRLSKTMFLKTADYLKGELCANCEDYRLIEEMNRVTINRYADMKQIASNVNKSLIDLGDKYKQLEPYLKQIDDIDDAVLKLEQAAHRLDAYSKKLEQKFKSLEQQ